MQTNIQKILLTRVLPGGFVFLVIALISVFALDNCKSGSVGNGKFEYELTVNSGDHANKIALELEKNKLIKSSNYFMMYLRYTGQTNKLQQGIYTLNDGMSMKEIIQALSKGKVKMTSFTIPEGYHNRQIADLLVEKKIIGTKEEFMKAASSPEILSKYKIPGNTSEGYLFPETYTIPTTYKVDRIIDMMIRRFFENLKKIEKAKEVTPEELHKKVIMASIVEREAKKPEERPKMAGVFFKRLKDGIPFESCATVQYLFERPKKRLLERDLLQKSPYNTYLNKGYPPGAISNPGLAAIKSAFEPEETEYLFFLRKPDGSHYFSKTFREHAGAKKKYIDVLYD